VSILGIDFETYSAMDVTQCGSDAYASHETTGIHCAVLGDWVGPCDPKELIRWFPGDELPAWAVRHVRSGGPVLAHNWTFEHSIIRYLLSREYGWPLVKPGQWLDTAQIAAVFSLPRSLEALGKVIGAPVEKDMVGNALMLKHCRVRKSKATGGWDYPKPTPEEIKRIGLYCERDVVSMVGCYYKLPRPTRTEVRVMQVDREINDRGVFLDQSFAAKMHVLVKARAKQLDRAVFELTGDLIGLTGVPALKRWLVLMGVEVPVVKERKKGKVTEKETLDKAAVGRLIASPETPTLVRQVMEMRRESAKTTSLAKLDRVPQIVSADGRLRFALLYGGAHTLRWSSKGLQVHNLAKVDYTLPGEPKSAGVQRAADIRAAVLRGSLDDLGAIWANVLQALSMQLRSVLVAAPGKELIGADYSAIEPRVLAWLAGELGVLDAFRAGRDVYVEDAAKFGSTDRQLGKVRVLSLGYQMGVASLAARGADAGFHLSLKEWKAAHTNWRENNPRIVQFWSDLEEAFGTALDNPGTHVPIGEHLTMICGKEVLRIVLPSGRSLHYWRPRRRRGTRTVEIVTKEGVLEERVIKTNELVFLKAGGGGMMPETTYGGKLAENITQAISRDLLASGQIRFAETCYPIVLHVHDSLIAEVDKGAGDVEEFSSLMAESPAWAHGLPVEAEGYRSRHFQG